MKRIGIIMLAVCLLVCAFAGCNKKPTEGDLLTGKHYAKISVENYGDIVVELDADTAPITVTNFVNLVNDKFYDGVTFHRIMEGFMMQGGDPDGDGIGGAETTIKGEFTANGYQNNISHTRGVISMARTNDPDSASSQFFIVHEDSEFLDGQYAAFGHVVSGMEVVDAVCENTPVVDDNGTVLAAKQPKMTAVRMLSDYTPPATTTQKPTVDTSNCLKGKHLVEITVENYGVIKLELDADTAPITVTNFVKLAKEGFYDGLTFHRIIDGFMIQGGDPEGNGTGGSDEEIVGEFAANGYENNISHKRGVISMARSNKPNSASSQFFIVHEDSPHLDGNYAAFGHVLSGIEVVDAICENTPVQDSNGTVAAADQPKITSVHVLEG